MSFLKEYTFKTQGNTDIIDITPHLLEFIEEAGITEGIVSVFVRGSTGAISVIEYEPNLVKDFKEAMERIAPEDKDYHHHKTWGDYNGHSHIRASVVGCSETLPVSNGQPLLGQWQQLVLIDFDTGPRTRTVIMASSD
ncbi:MAG: YjbQ family protein [Elusimicrobia bacterium]|nr:YjbQ family protein [Elusimicrobiota bacterium]